MHKQIVRLIFFLLNIYNKFKEQKVGISESREPNPTTKQNKQFIVKVKFLSWP